MVLGYTPISLIHLLPCTDTRRITKPRRSRAVSRRGMDPSAGEVELTHAVYGASGPAVGCECGHGRVGPQRRVGAFRVDTLVYIHICTGVLYHRRHNDAMDTIHQMT